jgi:hypothetical protein
MCTSNLSSVIFCDKATAFSLFPGSGYATGYKISQQIWWFSNLIHSTPSSVMGLSRRSVNDIRRLWWMLLQAAWPALVKLSGSLSHHKIRMQVNPGMSCSCGVFYMFPEEGSMLYHRWGWTMAKCPGSFTVMPHPFPPCILH